MAKVYIILVLCSGIIIPLGQANSLCGKNTQHFTAGTELPLSKGGLETQESTISLAVTKNEFERHPTLPTPSEKRFINKSNKEHSETSPSPSPSLSPFPSPSPLSTPSPSPTSSPSPPPSQSNSPSPSSLPIHNNDKGKLQQSTTTKKPKQYMEPEMIHNNDKDKDQQSTTTKKPKQYMEPELIHNNDKDKDQQSTTTKKPKQYMEPELIHNNHKDKNQQSTTTPKSKQYMEPENFDNKSFQPPNKITNDLDEDCAICCALDELPPYCTECCQDVEGYSLPINVLKSLSK